MKKFFPPGSLLFVLLMGGIAILVTSTQLLLPAKFKHRYDNVLTNQYHEETQDNHVVDYGYYDEPIQEMPLFNDDINLNHLEVSEPVGYQNLEVCLIYGRADLDKKKYTTLNNALKKNMVTVHETQDVNELRMDNNSNEYIYINSGEIVKGGQQDRTIQYDVVIAPNEKNVDLASFCVESGRWQQRGEEDYMAFRSSEKMVSNSDLKLAAKHDKNQSKVWTEVANYQVETENSVNANYSYTAPVVVADSTSVSSLELTLENKEIEKIQKEYRDHILQQLINKPNVIGFAYFINGKLCGIDIYNNHQLFADLFNKLFDATIAEAISVYNAKQKIVQPNNTSVVQLLGANAMVYRDEMVNANTQFRTSQHNFAKNILIFTSFDKKEKGWLHRNWLDNKENMNANTNGIPIRQEEPFIIDNEVMNSED